MQQEEQEESAEREGEHIIITHFGDNTSLKAPLLSDKQEVEGIEESHEASLKESIMDNLTYMFDFFTDVENNNGYDDDRGCIVSGDTGDTTTTHESYLIQGLDANYDKIVQAFYIVLLAYFAAEDVEMFVSFVGTFCSIPLAFILPAILHKRLVGGNHNINTSILNSIVRLIIRYNSIKSIVTVKNVY
ncbi:hypothetical protein Pmar_PMAR019044 [Perkinsus marinus ATCC 50983]|uniref:Amino acid transporter transmembrane domain-containing protein n=1 Tax=Perkinsus marinus (strain ATCC 50983 / TXsc) TaxID=423536 RepID=C5KTQ0_PERM5|nr:hypothetical protein Pmar_PMAR019044 [Perkinsus marinus ATCC 50983]EER11942.1 hypothetical protein Pmar_PMAR019044 [Perkinsus marinus ATCC 50983]|eukprot:XP_002780147.1 hypothetical protein Pmar_PMAR019044 [Perkinsus marinus ATCC 50983]